MDKKEFNKILTTVKVLNEFSRKHSEFNRKLHKQLEANDIKVRSSNGLSGYVEQFPDWFVDIIDYGQGGLEDITDEMLNNLLKEMSEFDD